MTRNSTTITSQGDGAIEYRKSASNSLKTSSDDGEKKPRHCKYSACVEKKFPKIRISLEDYNHLKSIRQKYHFKSFGQAIAKVLDVYRDQLDVAINA